MTEVPNKPASGKPQSGAHARRVHCGIAPSLFLAKLKHDTGSDFEVAGAAGSGGE
jgi:hypothetical protein